MPCGDGSTSCFILLAELVQSLSRIVNRMLVAGRKMKSKCIFQIACYAYLFLRSSALISKCKRANAVQCDGEDNFHKDSSTVNDFASNQL